MEKKELNSQSGRQPVGNYLGRKNRLPIAPTARCQLQVANRPKKKKMLVKTQICGPMLPEQLL